MLSGCMSLWPSAPWVRRLLLWREWYRYGHIWWCLALNARQRLRLLRYYDLYWSCAPTCNIMSTDRNRQRGGDCAGHGWTSGDGRLWKPGGIPSSLLVSVSLTYLMGAQYTGPFDIFIWLTLRLCLDCVRWRRRWWTRLTTRGWRPLMR